MSPEQKAAHLRMLESLPRRTMLKLDQGVKVGRSQLPEVLIDEWVHLRKSGKTYPEIASMYGVCHKTINRHVRRRLIK